MLAMPVLAESVIPGRMFHKRTTGVLQARGGLCDTGHGDLPFFVLNARVFRKGFPDQLWMCGLAHQEITEQFPHLLPLSRLHMCSMNGLPIHAVDNGQYWVESFIHYGNPSYLKTVTDHFRCTDAEALQLVRDYDSHDGDDDEQRNVIVRFVRSMLPRWKAEADSVIAALNLRPFVKES